MAEEFEAVNRLKRLNDDAKRAAAVLDAAEELDADEQQRTTVVELTRTLTSTPPTSHKGPGSSQEEVALQPVSLSTLVLVSTKKRLARASHLQAASEQLPNTQWEIVDEAINEWCKSRGY